MTTTELYRQAEEASRIVFNTSVFSPAYAIAKEASFKAWNAYNDSQNVDRLAQGLLPITLIQA